MGKPIRIKGPGARHVDASLRSSSPGKIATVNALGPVIYAFATRDGRIKIGYSEHLGNRSARFGGMGRLLAFAPGATMAEERALHAALAEHTDRDAEFYRPHPDVLTVINDMRARINMAPLDHDDLAA